MTRGGSQLALTLLHPPENVKASRIAGEMAVRAALLFAGVLLMAGLCCGSSSGAFDIPEEICGVLSGPLMGEGGSLCGKELTHFAQMRHSAEGLTLEITLANVLPGTLLELGDTSKLLHQVVLSSSGECGSRRTRRAAVELSSCAPVLLRLEDNTEAEERTVHEVSTFSTHIQLDCVRHLDVAVDTPPSQTPRVGVSTDEERRVATSAFVGQSAGRLSVNWENYSLKADIESMAHFSLQGGDAVFLGDLPLSYAGSVSIHGADKFEVIAPQKNYSGLTVNAGSITVRAALDNTCPLAFGSLGPTTIGSDCVCTGFDSIQLAASGLFTIEAGVFVGTDAGLLTLNGLEGFVNSGTVQTLVGGSMGISGTATAGNPAVDMRATSSLICSGETTIIGTGGAPSVRIAGAVSARSVTAATQGFMVTGTTSGVESNPIAGVVLAVDTFTADNVDVTVTGTAIPLAPGPPTSLSAGVAIQGGDYDFVDAATLTVSGTISGGVSHESAGVRIIGADIEIVDGLVSISGEALTTSAGFWGVYVNGIAYVSTNTNLNVYGDTSGTDSYTSVEFNGCSIDSTGVSAFDITGMLPFPSFLCARRH